MGRKQADDFENAIFPFVSRKKTKGQEKSDVGGKKKCNYIFLECHANSYWCFCVHASLSYFFPPPSIFSSCEWYNETFNFAYNLENGFYQTDFWVFCCVEKVIHGKLWSECSGGDDESLFILHQIGCRPPLTHANIAPSQITFFATCLENVFAFFRSCLIKKKEKLDRKNNESEHNTTRHLQQ